MAIQQNNKSAVKTYVPYTGYVAVDVLAFDPTDAEYEAITGRKHGFPLDYNANDEGVITHRVLVREVTRNTFAFMEFRIGNTPWESKTGKFQWVDKNFNFGWAATADEVNSDYGFDNKSAKKSFKGLEEFGNFIKKMARITKDSDLVTVASGLEDIDINDVIKLKKKAVNKLIAECNIAPDSNGKGGYPYASISTAVSVYTSNAGKMRQVFHSHKDLVTAPDIKDGNLVPSKFWMDKVLKKIEESQSGSYPIIPASHFFAGMEVKDVDLTASSDDLPF